MIDAIALCRCIGLTNCQLCGQHLLGRTAFAMCLQVFHHTLQLIVVLVWLHLGKCNTDLNIVGFRFKRELTAKCPGFTESATRTSKYAPIAGKASYSLSCGNSLGAGAVTLVVLRGVVGGEAMPIAVVG